MTVIHAAGRFAQRANDGLWISLSGGGFGPLSEYENEPLIRKLLAAVAEKYPFAAVAASVAWDDASGTHLEVLYQPGPNCPGTVRGSVDVDGYHYSVTLEPEVSGGAA